MDPFFCIFGCEHTIKTCIYVQWASVYTECKLKNKKHGRPGNKVKIEMCGNHSCFDESLIKHNHLNGYKFLFTEAHFHEYGSNAN